MGWDRLRGNWKQFKGRLRQRWGPGRRARLAREQQLAEWLAREHKVDPIHK
jgi:hypothetical protein